MMQVSGLRSEAASWIKCQEECVVCTGPCFYIIVNMHWTGIVSDRRPYTKIFLEEEGYQSQGGYSTLYSGQFWNSS